MSFEQRLYCEVMDSLYIVMPAYNEEANIEAVIEAWYRMLKGEKSKLVIADSGSVDATHSILLGLQKKYPKLEILSDTEKQHGPKCIALYDYAIKQGADYIFQTDSDGQTNPSEFTDFWDARIDNDIVLGYRPVRGDGKIRAFAERVVCLLVRVYFGVKVPDANAPFRLMKTEVVKEYLHKLPADYNLPNIMLTTYFVHYQERVSFKKITFNPRQGGVNSVNLIKLFKIGVKSLRDFYMLKKTLK